MGIAALEALELCSEQKQSELVIRLSMKQEECEDLEAQVDDALAEVRDKVAVAATSRGGKQQLAALRQQNQELMSMNARLLSEQQECDREQLEQMLSSDEPAENLVTRLGAELTAAELPMITPRTRLNADEDITSWIQSTEVSVH